MIITMKIKNIIGFEGLYAATDDGRIYSLRKGTELKQTIKNGYCYVPIKGKQKQVHRLVFEAFHGCITECLVIDHIDGNPLNNNISNLRQITNRENVSLGHLRKKKHSDLPTGVTYFSKISKYGAYINIEKDRYYLGVFDSIADASNARNNALEIWLKHGEKPKEKDKTTKYCKRCNRDLPRTDFYKNVRGWYSCLCRECTKIEKREKYNNSK